MKVTINGKTWNEPVRNRHRRAAEQFSGISITSMTEVSDEAVCAYVIGTVAAITGESTDTVDDALSSQKERARLLNEIIHDTVGDIVQPTDSDEPEGNAVSATP